MRLRGLLEEIGRGATVRSVADACLEEDHTFIQRRDPTDRTTYRGSRVAKGRFDRNRQVYKMAMRRWQQSPEAKAFYRRLARWNKLHWGFMGRFKGRAQESLGARGGAALLEFFELLVDQFVGRQDELAELGTFAGYLADEMRGALTESSGAWLYHYEYAPYYLDWYAGFADLLAA